jgi:hypothetical protein
MSIYKDCAYWYSRSVKTGTFDGGGVYNEVRSLTSCAMQAGPELSRGRSGLRTIEPYICSLDALPRSSSP